MSFIDDIKLKAKNDLKTIILPESMDKRVLKAAGIVAREGIARVIVVGEANKIKELDSNFDFNLISVINPETYEDTDNIIGEFTPKKDEKIIRIVPISSTEIKTKSIINKEDIETKYGIVTYNPNKPNKKGND